MEQVAEALKQLKVNGEWSDKSQWAFEEIKSKAWDSDLVILDGYELEAVLNAIIELYGTN
jgi:hypothetical protein